MTVFLSAVMAEVVRVDPPSGGISPLAWTIIVVLASALGATVPALWKQNRQMYRDLKECNERSNQKEDEVLGLLKVVRVQMEVSKGGKPR